MYKIDLNEFGTFHCIANLKYHDDPSRLWCTQWPQMMLRNGSSNMFQPHLDER